MEGYHIKPRGNRPCGDNYKHAVDNLLCSCLTYDLNKLVNYERDDNYIKKVHNIRGFHNQYKLGKPRLYNLKYSAHSNTSYIYILFYFNNNIIYNQ